MQSLKKWISSIHYSRDVFILSVVCFFIFIMAWGDSSAQAQKVNLPAWQTPSGMTATELSLGTGEMIRGGWGNYSLTERKYFDEVLPSIFKRTLEVDSMKGDRGLKWIFTGPRVGLYITLENNTFIFYQQYYDSFGFNKGLEELLIYPRSMADTTKITSDSTIRSIAVEMDHKLGLKISLNGKEVIQQKYIEDIRRNQLQLTGREGTFTGRMLEPETIEESVTVSPDSTYQQMLGWGGTTTPTAYDELSEDGKAKWWEYIKEYNLLGQREYPVGGVLNYDLDNFDDVSYAKAHYYGDNFPNGEMTDFEYNAKIQEMGGFVLFEFWDFPQWIDGDEDEYVRAMVGYCKEALKKTGRPPRIVGVQNEVNMPEEEVKKFVPALREGLDEAGFEKVKIHTANAGNIVKALDRAPRYTQNPEVWKQIDYSATNQYDYQEFFTNPDGYDKRLIEWKKTTGSKPFLAVELSVNAAQYQTDSYRIAITMGQLYQKNLTLADAVLIGYCWNILNIEQPNFGATRSLFISSPEQGFMPVPSSNQLRVFGAYSRRIKQGMTRVKTETTNKNLKIVAFKGEDHTGTAVVLNRNLNPVELEVDWEGMEFTEMETVDPYSPNIVKSFNVNKVKVEGGAFVTLTNVPLEE